MNVQDIKVLIFSLCNYSARSCTTYAAGILFSNEFYKDSLENKNYKPANLAKEFLASTIPFQPCNTAMHLISTINSGVDKVVTPTPVQVG